MSRRDDDEGGIKLVVGDVEVWLAPLGVKLLVVLLLVLLAGFFGCRLAHAAPRVASYASQRSSGYPLVVMPPLANAGQPDTAAVRYLAKFEHVTLELTPWAQGVDGLPRWDVPNMLRQINPSIRLWLYVCMDPWLPQSFAPQTTDHSAFRDMFDATASGNGYLYDTQGRQWWGGLAFISLNMGDAPTMQSIGDVLVRQVRVFRPDGVFLDNVQRTRAWASGGANTLDVERAGFRSLAAMDSAASDNLERLVARLHEASPCLLVAANCGPEPKPFGVDVDFREGLGSLISFNDARRWMQTPGKHWLLADCNDSLSCYKAMVMLKSAALGNPNAIISAGPDRGWPPSGR